MSNTLLNVENLTKIFKVGMSKVIAVDDVSFGIDKNDSVSIVGESGSGKNYFGKFNSWKLKRLPRDLLNLKIRN